MSDSVTAVVVEIPLLEKRRTHVKRVTRMHGVAHALYKRRAEIAPYTTVFLSLGVACLNPTFGIGRPAAATALPAIVSGCLSLLSGSVTALNNGFEWPNKAKRHYHFASRFKEVVRDISTWCSLRHLHNAEYASEGDFLRHLHDAEYASDGDFLRHLSTEMSRL
jgi:hypothetical protein